MKVGGVITDLRIITWEVYKSSLYVEVEVLTDQVLKKHVQTSNIIQDEMIVQIVYIN